MEIEFTNELQEVLDLIKIAAQVPKENRHDFVNNSLNGKSDEEQKLGRKGFETIFFLIDETAADTNDNF